MKLSKSVKIELAASTDDTRHVLKEPYLDIRQEGEVRVGKLVATDGRIIAIVPVELDEHDSEGWVSADVLKTARKEAPKSGMDRDKAIVTCNGKAELPSGITMPRSSIDMMETNSEGLAANVYPNWREVTTVLTDEATQAADGTCVDVAIDVSLLWKLAQAMGTEKVRLRVPAGGTGAIAAWAANMAGSNGATGVIMPLRLT